MQTRAIRTAFAVAALAAVGAPALAQAPASAQVWDVRFLITGAGPSTDLVNITLQARVGIRPNPNGTTNLGVSRVGGNFGTLNITATDSSAISERVSRFELATVPGGNDINGNPLAGTFRPFRQGFAPANTGGSNADSQNGILSVNALAHSASLTNLVHSRTTGFDGNALGVATLDGSGAITGGDYANIFSFNFIPKLADYNRPVTLSVSGLSARYLFKDNGAGNASSSSSLNLPSQSITFFVPAPSAAAALSLAGIVASRRRRA